MSFGVSKQLGPAGPPDLNRRSIYVRQDKGGNRRITEIIEMRAVDPMIGWIEKDDRVIEAILTALKREWPELAE